MTSVQTVCLCASVILFQLMKQSGALNCSQCNVRFMGVQNLCSAPRNATDCIACMKTVAKVKLRDSGYIDGWERMSVVVSRYCITPGNQMIKPAGCYKQLNNGGYTERCYCYTDNCNSGASKPAFGVSLPFFSLPLSTLILPTTVLVLLEMLFSNKNMRGRWMLIFW